MGSGRRPSPAAERAWACPAPGGGAGWALLARSAYLAPPPPGPHGTMETRCVSSMEEAAQFLGLRLVSGAAPAGVKGGVQ